jgi:hypothetical protein
VPNLKGFPQCLELAEVCLVYTNINIGFHQSVHKSHALDQMHGDTRMKAMSHEKVAD